MPGTIAQMTKKEFSQLISEIVEQKLIDLFGDPDEGQLLKLGVRKRLLRQKKAVAKGERGDDFERVVKRLSLR